MTVALLDAIGAVLIGAVVTFFATQHFLKPPVAAIALESSKLAAAAAAAAPAAPAVAQAAAKKQGGGAGKADYAGAKKAKAADAGGGAPGFGEFDADTTLALIKTRRSIFPKASFRCFLSHSTAVAGRGGNNL